MFTNKHISTSMEVYMYFNYHGNNYAINCDWLQYSVFLGFSDPELKCPEGYRIDLCQGNNIFEKRAIVMDQHGVKILTLLWKPYSKILNPNIMTVQVANVGLYTKQILSSLDLVKEIVWCQFNSLGRIDICCDFDMNAERMKVVKHLNSGHYYVERKSEGSVFWHEIKQKDQKKKNIHCLSWGSKNTEIKVKLYNKTRELGVGNTTDIEKPWIVEEWDNAKIDKNNAWRLEFSLKSNGQLRYNERQILLSDIANEFWLATVFIELFYNRFITRVNQGKREGHKNKDKRIFLLDLPQEFTQIYWANNESNKPESIPAIKLLRSLLSQLSNEALIADKGLFKEYCNTITEVVTKHHLENYFETRFGVNCVDYLANEAANAGSGVNQTILNPSKLLS